MIVCHVFLSLTYKQSFTTLCRCVQAALMASSARLDSPEDQQVPGHCRQRSSMPGSDAQQLELDAASTSAQPATHARVPQALLAAAAGSGGAKNRPPQYDHILRSVYTRGVAKPKRRQQDIIPVCTCKRLHAGGHPMLASPAQHTPRTGVSPAGTCTLA